MRSVTIAAAVALLAGCTVGPDYERPATELPAAWPAGESVTADAGREATTVRSDWWRTYDDPILVRLVERTLTANDDIQLAAARVAEARAILRFTEADRLPQLDAEASAGRMRSSGDLIQAGAPRTVSNFRLAGLLSYEGDLWGRLARADEAARASLLASEAARDAVRLQIGRAHV